MVPMVKGEGLASEIFHDIAVEAPKAAVLAIPYIPDLLENAYAVQQRGNRNLSRGSHHAEVIATTLVEGTADFVMPLTRRAQNFASQIERVRKNNPNIPANLPSMVFGLSAVLDAATLAFSIMAGGGFGSFVVRRVLTGAAEHLLFGIAERRIKNMYPTPQTRMMPPPTR